MERTIQTLIHAGWVEYPDTFRQYARTFYKRFDTPTRCSCNRDKPGMQVCCAMSEFDGRVSTELDLCGELPDGTWIKLQQWALPADVEQVMKVIQRMLATWEYAANYGKEG